MRHENRHIANDIDTLFGAVAFQSKPLFVEKILIKFLRFDFILQLFSRQNESRFVTQGKLFLPGVPSRAIVRFQQSAKERVIIEPFSGIAAESFKLGSQMCMS